MTGQLIYSSLGLLPLGAWLWGVVLRRRDERADRKR
jgi:uncharacterized protein (TIGR03382 family)